MGSRRMRRLLLGENRAGKKGEGLVEVMGEEGRGFISRRWV